ncbi:hypothetical protein TIFTF001_016926 [Ficus carica]|uniref:Uncharacterized protein n=1 Tax=Ficus carica TaxID=3494 RepID=A0AA88A9M5_FICCA|nr:hypothetical protein TIFTF001_016926 [Ficus carica]
MMADQGRKQRLGEMIFELGNSGTQRLDKDRGSKTQAAHGKEEGQSTEQQGSSRWARREGEVGQWVNSSRRNQGQFDMGWAHRNAWRAGTPWISGELRCVTPDPTATEVADTQTNHLSGWGVCVELVIWAFSSLIRQPKCTWRCVEATCEWWKMNPSSS